MASKQKSFFDQKPNNHPQGWKPNKSSKSNKPPYATKKPDAPVKAPPARPIEASNTSKAKLKAFVLQKTGPLPPEDSSSDTASEGKENEVDGNDQSEKMSPQSTPQSSLRAPGNTATNGRREYPKTPVGRVPLKELIGNSGDQNDLQQSSPTPVDQVLWKHSPSTLNEENIKLIPRRKDRKDKKRARSSSPHLVQPEASNHFVQQGETLSFDLQTLHKSLKTPQADPAGDLWSRYSLPTTDKKASDDKSSPTIANFLNSSSPQTPARHPSVQDSGGLRRTMSCGLEWPVSVTKRRKVTKDSDHAIIRESVTTEANKKPASAGNISRVNSLLERIQHGLGRSATEPERPGPSSSSPLERTNVHLSQNGPQVSTKAMTRQEMQGPVERHPSQMEAPTIRSSQHDHTGKQSSSVGRDKTSSSEFGTDDIDNEFLAEVDASITAASLDERETVMEAAPNNATTSLLEDTRTESGKDEFDDVFDDSDDDQLAADLEEVAALYDRQVLPEIKEQATTRQTSETENSNTAPGKACLELSSDDEFGDDLEFESLAAEYVRSTQGDAKYVSTIQRYQIITVAEGQYEIRKGFFQPEKVLLVQEDRTKSQKAISLRQSWLDSPCTPGSFVHVVGDFDAAGQCAIDDSKHMLILHPDHLISATVVADSFSCTRRAVLQDRAKTTNESSEPQVYGHILHEIFQEAMKANRWDIAWLTELVKFTTSRYLETLFEINVEMARAIDHLLGKIPELQAWAEIFVTARPKPDAIVKDNNGAALICVNKLLDVEEHVWSPTYGLKGNIDASVQIVMQEGKDVRTLTVPFELKTGKHMNASHRAQTALYTLLLSDRYDVQIACGILYYMETSETKRVLAIRHEIRHMIMQRNELACYVRQRLELPPMLRNEHTCGRCYAKTPCFTYHKLVDDGNGETSGMGNKFDEAVGHLQPVHQEFFKKWDALLTKEEADVLKFRRELWTMLSSEREKVGRCFGNLVIEPGSAQELKDQPKINRFVYTLTKQKAHPSFSFTESQIIVGEPIVISDEKGHYALANGYVTIVRKRQITVAVDRRLHNARIKHKDFDAEKFQSFAGIMEVVEKGKNDATIIPKEPEEPVVYRLDKDEFSNGMSLVRNNLLRMMEKDLYQAKTLRELVIEGVPPKFREVPKNSIPQSSYSTTTLNVDQRNAIKKVMSGKDYALVLGMPGTGKTTTIAHIIRALVAQGKSILLTSYTHTAVDNILLKIRNDKIGILRLGTMAKIHPDVKDFADLACIQKRTLEELTRSYKSQVVATTCLGINHPIFNQRLFDYCIVDEASQITLPVCLGPIRMARTFILVGDHYQLPPLVQNREALAGGLDISLFKLLSDTHPSSVVNLEHQYRMCAEIMSLSNILIYDGRLKCGTEAVATSSVSIPHMSRLESHHHTPQTISSTQKAVCPSSTASTCWLSALLDPKVKVCFLNTDLLALLSTEIARGSDSRITNPCEALLTTQLIEALLTVGIPIVDIGVITLYRSQLTLLRNHLRHRVSAGLEMHTADKFQGRDKEVVVLSLVRSNESGNVGDLLKDWRRVNVALTRARTKLLIIGSRETMRKGNALLKEFVELVEGNGWVYDLRQGAMEDHYFEEVVGTQGSVISGGRGPAASAAAVIKEDATAKANVEEDEFGDEDMDDADFVEAAAAEAPNIQPEVRIHDFATAAESPLKEKSRNIGTGMGSISNSNSNRMKIPEKRAGMDPKKMFANGRRPVIRDVLAELMG